MNEVIISKLEELAQHPVLAFNSNILSSNELQAIRDDFCCVYRESARIPPGVMSDIQLINFVAHLYKVLLRYIRPEYISQVTPIKVCELDEILDCYKYKVEWKKPE